MSQQSKAKSRQMRNGYAHMSGSMRRPHVAGRSYLSVGESIAKERKAAQRAANINSKRKVK